MQEPKVALGKGCLTSEDIAAVDYPEIAYESA